METIKDIYKKIDSWVKNNDKTKIDFLRKERCYDRKSELGRLQETLDYYDIINECKGKKEYIFGEKLITVKEIGKYMIDYIGDYGPKKGQSREEFNEDCMHSGYATIEMFKEIKAFWKNLDEDDVIAVAAGQVEDRHEIDLDGYRCYFLSRSGVHPLLFNYIYYTLKKTTGELDDELCNSNDAFDRIINLFPPEEIFLPDSDVIDRLYGKNRSESTEKNIDRFNRLIKDISENKDFLSEPELQEKIQELSKLMVKR